MPETIDKLILNDGDKTLRIGSLVSPLPVPLKTIKPRTGVVVEVREHDHNVDHPWFGNSVVVLWSDGQVSRNISARSLKIIEGSQDGGVCHEK
jgi:hypothetical protein